MLAVRARARWYHKVVCDPPMSFGWSVALDLTWVRDQQWKSDRQR